MTTTTPEAAAPGSGWDGWARACPFQHADGPSDRAVRLFLMSTGTLATAQLPFWLNWLSVNRPRYDVTVGLTDAAQEFVSATAVAALTDSSVTANTWAATAGGALEPVHTTMLVGYDGVLVYPASVDFVSALAAGSGSRPFTLALLGASVPVVIAPSFPPGVAGNPIVHAALDRVAHVPSYHLVRPHQGRSRSTGAQTDVTAPLWDVVAVLEHVLDADTALVKGRC